MIGDALGSRSQLCSLVAVATVVVTLLFLRPVLALFPMAALGPVVVYAALRLVDVGEFRRLASFRRSEPALALATTFGVLAFGVLNGVLVAVGLSVADLLRRVARRRWSGSSSTPRRTSKWIREDLAAAGFLDRPGPDRVFMTLPTAVTAYAQWFATQHGTPPPGIDPPPPSEPLR